MKSVLISIQPKWCELIASGKKTVEVRKTKPKIDMPFKCYIYCTKGEHLWKTKDRVFLDGAYNRVIDDLPDYLLDGKVIGEFVCDHFYGIINFLPYESDDNHHAIFPCVLEQTCLTEDEIDEYLGQKDGFGWHISDLVIYDNPKELSEFYHECNGVCFDTKKKIKCERIMVDGFSCNGLLPITRPRRVKEKTNPYGKPTLDYESGVKVLNMIDNAPTADVVPKSEVEKLKNELVIWKQDRFNLYQRLELYEMTRQKAARKILEELDSLIQNQCLTITDERGIKGYVDSSVHFALAELKKKYTESVSDDNKIS